MCWLWILHVEQYVAEGREREIQQTQWERGRDRKEERKEGGGWTGSRGATAATTTNGASKWSSERGDAFPSWSIWLTATSAMFPSIFHYSSMSFADREVMEEYRIVCFVNIPLHGFQHPLLKSWISPSLASMQKLSSYSALSLSGLLNHKTGTFGLLLFRSLASVSICPQQWDTALHPGCWICSLWVQDFQSQLPKQKEQWSQCCMPESEKRQTHL